MSKEKRPYGQEISPEYLDATIREFLHLPQEATRNQVIEVITAVKAALRDNHRSINSQTPIATTGWHNELYYMPRDQAEYFFHLIAVYKIRHNHFFSNTNQ